MPVHTRDGQIVIDPTGNWHDSLDPSRLTTTRSYFTRDNFLAIRAGIQKLEGAQEGAEALRQMKAGESLSPAQKDLLKANLGSFAENRDAVDGVGAWVKGHGMEVPEAVVRQGAEAVFPMQMSAAATALSDRLGAGKAGSALSTMRDITAGKAVSETARSAATKAFEEAGLLTPNGEMTSVGILMLKQEGATFLAKAGIVTAEGARTASQAFAAVVRTLGQTPAGGLPVGLASAGEKLAASETVAAEASVATRIAGETAEAARLFIAGTGVVMKKIPGAGLAIAAGAAIMSIAGAARAQTLPAEPQGAPQTQEEKKARQVLEMQAEGRKLTNVSKEVIKGALSFLPVPGVATAFENYSDSGQLKLQARMDAAAEAGFHTHLRARERAAEADGLVQQASVLDGTGPVGQTFNAQAVGRNNGPAATATLAADAGIPQQKAARNGDGPH